MALVVESSFEFNCVILITSPSSIDEGDVRRLDEDIQIHATSSDINYLHREISRKSDLIKLLLHIGDLVNSDGLKPILHFHMHGDGEKGLEISQSGEFLEWPELSYYLKIINSSMLNELCVVSTVCHAYRVTETLTLLDVTPFFCMIAPENEVTQGYIRDKISPFYREIFAGDSINDAYQILSNEFKFYHCEKVLMEAIAIYVIEHCKGKAKRTRKEQLLSDVLASGKLENDRPLSEIRAEIREQIEPNQDLLNKLIKRFLIDRPINCTMDDILSLVEQVYA